MLSAGWQSDFPPRQRLTSVPSQLPGWLRPQGCREPVSRPLSLLAAAPPREALQKEQFLRVSARGNPIWKGPRGSNSKPKEGRWTHTPTANGACPFPSPGPVGTSSPALREAGDHCSPPPTHTAKALSSLVLCWSLRMPGEPAGHRVTHYRRLPGLRQPTCLKASPSRLAGEEADF